MPHRGGHRIADGRIVEAVDHNFQAAIGVGMQPLFNAAVEAGTGVGRRGLTPCSASRFLLPLATLPGMA